MLYPAELLGPIETIPFIMPQFPDIVKYLPHRIAAIRFYIFAGNLTRTIEGIKGDASNYWNLGFVDILDTYVEQEGNT